MINNQDILCPLGFCSKIEMPALDSVYTPFSLTKNLWSQNLRYADFTWIFADFYHKSRYLEKFRGFYTDTRFFQEPKTVTRGLTVLGNT